MHEMKAWMFLKKKFQNQKINYTYIIKIMGIVYAISLLWQILANSESLFSSDSLASDIIAQQLASSGKLSIRSYVSQQTFWVFNVLFWFPKYFLNLFINNTIVVDKIVIAALYALLLGLAFRVANSYGENKTTGWIMLCVLGCGISNVWVGVGIIEPAYTIHMIYMLIFLLLTSNVIDSLKKKQTKKSILLMLILTLFLIYILLFDQRYMAVFIVPFCAASVIVLYFEYRKKESINKVERKAVFDIVLIDLLIFCAAAIGLYCNAYLKSVLPFASRLTEVDLYNFIDFENLFSEIGTYILSILKLWGGEFLVSTSTISVTSAVYLLKSCACFLVMIVIPCICTFKYWELPAKLRFLLVFYWIMSAELFYVYALSALNSPYNSRYYAYEIPVAIIISSWYLWESMVKAHKLDRYLFVLIVLLFGIISQLDIGRYIKGQERSFDQRQQVVETLQEHNMTYGYSTYWNAQILTSISNAQIKILPVAVGSTMRPFYAINYINQFDASNHSGDTFLLLTKDEYDEMVLYGSRVYYEIGMPKEMIELEDYVILLYEYNIAERAEYFPYNNLYEPMEGAYSIKKIILEKKDIEVKYDQEVNIVEWPINILPNTYYKLLLTMKADAEAIEWSYMDFCGIGYDNMEQDRFFECEDGEANYELIIYSGESEGIRDVALRLIFKNTEPVTISQLKLLELEVY